MTPAVPPAFASATSRRLFVGDRAGRAIRSARVGRARRSRSCPPVRPAECGHRHAPDRRRGVGRAILRVRGVGAGCVRRGAGVGRRYRRRSIDVPRVSSRDEAVGLGRQVDLPRGRAHRGLVAAAPGWKWDWLAVTKKGAGNVEQSADCTGGYCGAGGYLLYTYTGTLVEGSTVFDATRAGRQDDVAAGQGLVPHRHVLRRRLLAARRLAAVPGGQPPDSVGVGRRSSARALTYRCNELRPRGVIERINDAAHDQPRASGVEPRLGAGDKTWTSAIPGQGPERVRQDPGAAWRRVVPARMRGSSPTGAPDSSTTSPSSTVRPPTGSSCRSRSGSSRSPTIWAFAS